MTHTDPIYTLTLAFDWRPLVTCFGLEGLVDTLPRLEPNLYAVLDRHGRVIGDARRGIGPAWEVQLASGLRAGPGYIIV